MKCPRPIVNVKHQKIKKLPEEDLDIFFLMWIPSGIRVDLNIIFWPRSLCLPKLIIFNIGRKHEEVGKMSRNFVYVSIRRFRHFFPSFPWASRWIWT